MVRDAGALRRPPPIGPRGLVFAGIAAAGVWSFVLLDVPAERLLPGSGLLPELRDLRVLGDFLSRAVSPALDYESSFVPDSAPPLLMKVLDGAHRTVAYAAMAMTLSLLLAFPLGFVASSAWWRGDPARVTTATRFVPPLLFGGVRALIAFMRSIHELLWAIVFLAAMGYSTFAAILAIVIPYAGTLAKVFSEILDEAPRDTALALQATGASRTQVFVFGLLPRALPDMAAYAFYRFECAIRSAAILGFFGLETLGKFISSSFDEGYYGEVWTYIYALFALVLVMEWWSGALRRKVTA